VDSHIGRILKALIDSELNEETFILVTSDHGGRPGAFDHGEQSDSNLNIPLIVNGPGIKKNYMISKSNPHNLDVAPTLLYAIGLQPHPLWRGRVIEEIFEHPNQSEGFLA
jgi:arylsulfatase A-like enzyme